MQRALPTALLALVLAATASAQEGKRPLFESEAPLAVTLQAPWSDLLKNTKDPKRHPAVLEFADAQGPHRLDATVETRGLTRLRLCRFPPLKLRFAKGVGEGSVFAKQDELKMVTHCDRGQAYAQYYVQEWLAYRIYNLVTDRSFRARPLEVTYRDTLGAKPNGPHFAFVIEETGDMAKRVGLKRDAKTSFVPGDFEPLALSRFMLFQYLIGNTDWDVTLGPRKEECCHNVRVLGEGAGGRIAVPYDFDSAGLVNANYVAPHASLPIEYVTERLYRGFCAHNGALEAARQEYLGKRAAIMALVQGERRLSATRQREVAKFVEAFFETLASDEKFAREISGKCRK